MSTTIDSRVVEMRFDNRQFESNVATSMSTLDKLKEKLKLDGVSKGFENINTAAKGVDLSELGNGVDGLKGKFTALEIAAGVALGNIATKAMNVGSRVAKALTIEPIISGMKEYELQLNSVQTILANTQHKGTNIDQVNAALDQLNTYADKTIYNFAEMTRNIGTFTAAGVGLNESVSAIKGIANLAAMSGSSSHQASTAMYQLSQALAAGRVSLMDWNSVVNAGMGGEVFQNALKRTARSMGIAVDDIIDKYGSFRESLTQGQWLTTDVLTETLAQLSGAYSEADLIAQGYTESQAKEIMQLAKTAEDAATKVKTFSQLVDTTKEAIQSGWAQSWRLILGDFEEARELFTSISKVLGDMISESSDYRNKILSEWHDLGGRDDLIEGLANAFKGLMSVITPVKEAFRDIFPRLTAQNLLDFTSGFKELTSHMKLSKDSSEKLKTTFQGLFSILDIGKEAVMAVVKPLFNFATGGTISSIGNAILTLTAHFGEFFIKLRDGIKEGEAFSSAGGVISTALTGIGSAIQFVCDLLAGMGGVFDTVAEIATNAFSGIANAIGAVFDWLRGNITAEDIFAGIAGYGVFKAANNIAGVFGPIKEVIESLLDGSIKESATGFKDLLQSVHGSLLAFQEGIRIATLLAIAGAITLLASSIRILSEIDGDRIVISLGAIVASMLILNGGVKAIVNIIDDFDTRGTIRVATSMVALATSIKILASAISDLSSLSFGDIVQGLIAVGLSMSILTKGVNAISKSDVSLKTSLSIIALASACKILSSALKGFAEIDIMDTVQGLIAMSLALVEVVAVLKAVDKLGKGGFAGAAILLIAVQSLDDIASALGSIGALSWEEIARGLVGMGVALTEVAVISGMLGKLAGDKGLLGAATLVVAVQSLGDIADALTQIGSLSWEDVGQALLGMGGALAELAVVTGLLGKVAGLQTILGGAALVVAVQSLGKLADAMLKFGSLSFGQTITGLIGMGGALVELSVITTILGSVGGALPAALGGGALLIAVQGLGELADALQKFGQMSWGEIIKGLAAMATAMGVTALGGIINSLSGIGAGAIADVAGPLGVLADSIKKWAGIILPETIGSQLASLAKGVRAFTFSEWGAENMAIAVEPLGALAGAIKKWSGVVIPADLGTQLTSLATGLKAFTFAFIGAGTLVIAATGLSLLADALKKFQEMDLSFASFNIGQLVQGLLNLGNVGISNLILGFQNAASNIAIKAGEIVTNIQTMMSNFALAISSRITEIISNAQQIMLGIYTEVSTKATDIITSIKSTMTSFVSSVSEKVSEATTAMASVMSGIKGSVDAKKQEVVTAIQTTMSSFVSSISEKISDASSAMGQVISAIKTAADAGQSMYEAGVNLVQGLINGIGSMIQSAISAASNLASSVFNAAKNALGIHSPSRVFMEIGEHVVAGLVKGVRDNTSGVIKAGEHMSEALVKSASDVLDKFNDISTIQEQVGKSAVGGFVKGAMNNVSSIEKTSKHIADVMNNTIKTSFKTYDIGSILKGKSDSKIANNLKTSLSDNIDKIRDAINGELDTSPTIRPIVDLDDVKTKSKMINAMFSKKLATSTSRSVSRTNASNDDTPTPTNQNGNSFSFVQNNYSPKALSRADIYRRTKSQFNEMKEVLEF